VARPFLLITLAQDAPNYLPGIIAVMATFISTIIIASVTMVVLRLQNRRADAENEMIEGRQGFRWTV
jgi:Na+/alanine symporter